MHTEIEEDYTLKWSRTTPSNQAGMHSQICIPTPLNPGDIHLQIEQAKPSNRLGPHLQIGQNYALKSNRPTP